MEFREINDKFNVNPDTIHRISHLLADECWTMLIPDNWGEVVNNWKVYKWINGVMHYHFHWEQEFKIHAS